MLKSFLDRRAANIKAEKKELKDDSEAQPVEVDPDLSDDDFWAILQNLKLAIDSNIDDENPTDILEQLLEPFSDKQVEQFAEKYGKLNS